ncbi:hypothetical protein L345_16448, partial [Ophiophagus hannah]
MRVVLRQNLVTPHCLLPSMPPFEMMACPATQKRGEFLQGLLKWGEAGKTTALPLYIPEEKRAHSGSQCLPHAAGSPFLLCELELGRKGEEGAEPNKLPWFRWKFDGDPDQLALFLDSAEIYLKCYGHLYLSPRAMVNAISEWLEGEARGWLATLHKRRSPQLHDVDDFLQLLEVRFEEAEEDLYVEDELSSLKTSLDKQISKVTAYRDIPNRFSEWFRKPKREISQTRDHPAAEEPQHHNRPQNQPSHEVHLNVTDVGNLEPTPRARPERGPRHATKASQMSLQVAEVSPHPAEGRATPGNSDQLPDSYDSDNEDKNDPMVSGPVLLFVFPIWLTAPKTGIQGSFQALIDSGCTSEKAIWFKQVDGSLLGGAYATHLTKPVRLELADHWETIRFVMAPKMTDAVILGLSWLDKWGPTIWWQGGSCRLRIVKGHQPLPHHQIEAPPTQRTFPEDSPEQLAATSDKTPEVGQIPREYQDLAELFSETECDILPPHCEMDCAIEIIPGAKLPKPKMYVMTPREMQEMHKYIDKNLARGFIEPAKPWVAASDMLSHLAKGKVFTKLDFRKAYYQVCIRKGDEWKTAFNCPLESFQFKFMPFRLQGALALFMQLINKVLHKHLCKGVLVYLVNILIYTETMDDHIPLVRQVLEKLSNEGIEMDPAKVQAVLGWQLPHTFRQLQSFFGIAKPMTDLLKTGSLGMKPHPGQPLQWDLTCQKAFETLKELFAEEPLTDTERRWAAWEKEAFAVRWALQTWRHLLEGGQRPFEVWTDHKNLEGPHENYHPNKNFLTDALSPSTNANGGGHKQHHPPCPNSCPNQPADDLTTKLKTKLLADPWFWNNQHTLTKRDNLAWKGTKLYIPESLCTLVLQRSHDAKPAGHFGFLKTLHLAQRQFSALHTRTTRHKDSFSPNTITLLNN